MSLMLRTNDLKQELRPISENPRFAEAQAKLARFHGELHGLREAIDRENASWYAKQSSSISEDAILLADRMLDSQTLADDRDTATKLRELEKKIAIIRPAIARQQELVDRLRGELSVEAAKTVQAKHRKALANILEAARDLVAAANAVLVVKNILILASMLSTAAFLAAPATAQSPSCSVSCDFPASYRACEFY
jgi:hypothetical protein